MRAGDNQSGGVSAADPGGGRAGTGKSERERVCGSNGKKGLELRLEADASEQTSRAGDNGLVSSPINSVK